MATLAFAAIGQAIGAQIGGSVLGLSAAVIGQTAGAMIGQQIDARLMSGGTQRVEGPRLEALDVMTAQEGAGMPALEGRAAIAGQVIWATRLEEVKKTSTEEVGGKGGGQEVESTEYQYFANFAVAICEGPVRAWGRVWADDKLIDVSQHVIRFYKGGEAQVADPLIVAKEGSAPAYRGIAYVVFERFPLADFGNRLPQIKVEAWGRSGALEGLIRGVDLIPGSTEWGYMPDPVRKVSRSTSGEVTGEYAENCHRYADTSDLALSLDNLAGVLPEAETVALVVAWFGTDLRAGQCRIEPRVEDKTKQTAPYSWRVAGLDRASAALVSRVAGKPAFGSSPDDRSVIRAIAELRRRGKRVVLYPFLMMDIPGGTLPDPDGNGTQGAYPWRGRIRATAGQDVAAEVAAFLGAATPAQFTAEGEVVSYSGPAGDWGFRRFIYHLATLAQAAGGVDAFLIGSEMVGMTQSTAGGGSYPFVTGLKSIAAGVRSILPAAKISYAADWSEYHSHRPADGSIWFNLDPLWSDPNVDFIGIDNYFPLADWRDGSDHLDFNAEAGHVSQYDLDYLKSNIEGGEYFDWYYSNDADRLAQVRTPIADHLGERWVWQQKAVRAWHGAAHHNRPGGVRSATPTAWSPSSKPVWFTEIGCPAVDKGANQPNLFPSAVSSEGAFPHFSAATRDDFAPRQFLRAALEWWRDNGAGVVDPGDVLVWAWDARPWPEFPTQSSIWADGPDWTLGHWLNGRAGNAPAAEAIGRRLSQYHGLAADDFDVTSAHGQADGYAVSGAMPFRGYFQPFEVGLQIDAAEDGGRLTFRSRRALVPAASLTEADFCDPGDGATYTATRSAIEDVAREALVSFPGGDLDYRKIAARASLDAGPEDGVAEADLPLVLDVERGIVAAEAIIRQATDGRETISFALPPSRVEVKPGRLVAVRVDDGIARPYIVQKVTRGDVLRIEARSFAEGALAPSSAPRRQAPAPLTFGARAVEVVFLDLPTLPGIDAPDHAGFAAAFAYPWPGGADVLRSADPETGFALNLRIGSPARIGATVTALTAGKPGIVTGGEVEVEVYQGGLISRPLADVCNGANALAVQHAGGWEVLQYVGAELIGVGRWRLSGLIRGQRGTEGVAAADLPAGARVVILDRAVVPLDMAPQDVGRLFHYRTGPTDADRATYSARSHTFRGIGRRPFAPCHLRAVPQADGLRLSWIRRTRIEGDAWPDGPGDVPVGEASALFRVEVGPVGGDAVRVVEVTSPRFDYSAAMRAEDGLTGAFAFRVSQVSDGYGAGLPAALTVPA